MKTVDAIVQAIAALVTIAKGFIKLIDYAARVWNKNPEPVTNTT
jgi:hypothetical protein